MKILGISFAPLLIPLHRRLETLSISLMCFNVMLLPMFSIAFSTYLCFTKYWWITAAYVIWIIVDQNICETGGRPIKWVQSSNIFRYCVNYFPVRVKVVPEFKLDPKLNYLCGWFPHGFLPIGLSAGITTGFGDEFSNHAIHGVTISSNFYLPFFRDFMLSIGMCKASQKSINYLLSNEGGGKMLLVAVGGSNEALHFKSGEYRITLKNRKGFIKLALRNGSPVIPIFSFGENCAWNQIIFDDDSLIRRFQLWVREKTNFAPAILMGRGLLQYTYGILPFRTPINVVVGLPLTFGKIENPTQTEIDAAHEKFVEALVNIFETYKHNYEKCPDQCKLIID